jgi:hypothetical protein
VLTVIVTIMTITGRYICSTNSDVTLTGGLYAVLAVILTIMPMTGRSICNVSSYCDNNDNNEELYMQC